MCFSSLFYLMGDSEHFSACRVFFRGSDWQNQTIFYNYFVLEFMSRYMSSPMIVNKRGDASSYYVAGGSKSFHGALPWQPETNLFIKELPNTAQYMYSNENPKVMPIGQTKNTLPLSKQMTLFHTQFAKQL